jgi:predicted ester cyclase
LVKENIVNNRETVQSLMDSIQKGDFENAKTMLADDFRFSGAVPEPIEKEAWLGIGVSLKAAFPDLDYHFRVIGAEGDVVRSTSQMSGTHSGSFDLTGMSMRVIPATSKAFSVRPENVKVTVREGKVTAWIVEPAYGAGLTAILSLLGVEPAFR